VSGKKNFGITPNDLTFNWWDLTESINSIFTPATFLTYLMYSGYVKKASRRIKVDVVYGGQTMAPFVSVGDSSPMVAKNKREAQFIKLPMMALKKELDFETDEMVVPGQSQNNTSSNIISNARDLYVGEEQLDMKNRIIRRIEWMAAQTLNGKIVYKDKKMTIEIDFRMPEEHKQIYTGSICWDSSGAKIFKNLNEWSKLILTSCGYNPDVLVVGSNVGNSILENTDVVKLLDSRNIAVGALDLTKNYIEGARYLGTLPGGIKLYEYIETFSDGGVTKHMIEPNSVSLIATKAKFRRYGGPIFDKSINQVISSEFFSKTYIPDDPGDIEYLVAKSSQITVPHQPGAVVTAKVLEGVN